MQTTLETRRLILRPFVMEDLDDFNEYAKHPEVGPAAGWKPHESREESAAILQEFCKAGNLWALVLKETNHVIGSIGLHPDDRREKNCYMVGYVLSAAQWGNGLMPEAVRAVEAYAFQILSLPILTIYHFPFNNRSRRVIEKCGFRYEGTLRASFTRYDNILLDECCYSLTAEEYAASTAPAAVPVVAYCGVPGSYAEQAAVQYFGENAPLLQTPSFASAFEALHQLQAEWAVLPIENSSTGAIAEVYDLLGSYGFSIVGETVVTVSHCLLGIPGATLHSIRKVYSHQQGLIQSSAFLSRHPNWEQIERYNTAAAAKMVSESGDPTLAAIASKRAGELYGLSVLAEQINFQDQNQTRFVVVSRKAQHSLKNNKVSIAFTLPHVSGSLCALLDIFANENLNLVKIESRPILKRNWEYRFFLDFTADTIDQRIERVLQQAADHAQTLTVLGYYQESARSM